MKVKETCAGWEKKLVAKYMSEVAPKVEPAAVELDVQGEISGVRVSAKCATQTVQIVQSQKAMGTGMYLLASFRVPRSSLACGCGNVVSRSREPSPPHAPRWPQRRYWAGRDFERKKQSVRWVTEIEAALHTYIFQVFLSFAEEACKLGRQGVWGVEQVEREAREFLRRMTIEAAGEKGFHRSGHALRRGVGHW